MSDGLYIMENARKELLEHIKNRTVEYISIAYRKNYMDEPLRIKGTLDEVLPLLNFYYYCGYGGQELYGYIWYADGTWSDRGEYDGSEWWQYQARPNPETEIDV